jgi:hypothetical protein
MAQVIDRLAVRRLVTRIGADAHQPFYECGWRS